MTEPITVTVNTKLNGAIYWSQDVQVTQGSAINVNTDKPLATIMAERDKLAEFVERCARKGGVMVSGNQLSIAANNVLGRGAVVTNAEPNEESDL